MVSGWETVVRSVNVERLGVKRVDLFPLLLLWKEDPTTLLIYSNVHVFEVRGCYLWLDLQ